MITYKCKIIYEKYVRKSTSIHAFCIDNPYVFTTYPQVFKKTMGILQLSPSFRLSVLTNGPLLGTLNFRNL